MDYRNRMEALLDFDKGGPMSGLVLDELRVQMVKFLGLPDGTWLEDLAVEKNLQTIQQGLTLLRLGAPWTIKGHRFQLSREKGLRLDSPMQVANIQEALIDVLRQSGGSLRLCKRKGCLKFFVRHRRQIYCSKKCSGLARVRKHRSNRKGMRAVIS